MNTTVDSIGSTYCEDMCLQTFQSYKEGLARSFELKEKALEKLLNDHVLNVTTSYFQEVNAKFDSLNISFQNVQKFFDTSVNDIVKKMDLQTSIIVNATNVRSIESSKTSQYKLQSAIVSLTTYFQVFTLLKIIF